VRGGGEEEAQGQKEGKLGSHCWSVLCDRAASKE
jgi:hypothetical protein